MSKIVDAYVKFFEIGFKRFISNVFASMYFKVVYTEADVDELDKFIKWNFLKMDADNELVDLVKNNKELFATETFNKDFVNKLIIDDNYKVSLERQRELSKEMSGTAYTVDDVLSLINDKPNHVN